MTSRAGFCLVRWADVCQTKDDPPAAKARPCRPAMKPARYLTLYSFRVYSCYSWFSPPRPRNWRRSCGGRSPSCSRPTAGSLFVANRDSGSISVIDLRSGKLSRNMRLASAWPICRQFQAPTNCSPSMKPLTSCCCLQPGDDALQVEQRLAISPYPVSICVAPDGKQATIASLWSRRLTFVELGDSLQDRRRPRPAVCAALPACCLPQRPTARRRFVRRHAGADRSGQPQAGRRRANFPATTSAAWASVPDGEMLIVAIRCSTSWPIRSATTSTGAS